MASELPYIEESEVVIHRKYNPRYGDDRECVCGHPYHRHFDSHEDMSDAGCKYCPCLNFQEKPPAAAAPVDIIALITQLGAERDRIIHVNVDSQSLKGLKIEYRKEDNHFYVYGSDGSFKWSGEAGFNAWQCVKLSDEIATLKAELKLHRQKASNEYWAWQGDGSDHFETLVCPILIRPKDLEALVRSGLSALTPKKEESQ